MGLPLITRRWCMPNAITFSMKPVKELITKYAGELPTMSIVADPFARNEEIHPVFTEHAVFYISNDLDPDTKAQHHYDALDFLTQFKPDSLSMVLYDPPYSPRQVSEHYKRLGKTVDMKTTQASYWANQKKAIARAVQPGGYVITFGWNSGGIGKKLGFEIVEILLLAHGGWHNDTICTVERKL